jgi:hypothetical protein
MVAKSNSCDRPAPCGERLDYHSPLWLACRPDFPRPDWLATKGHFL